MELDLLSASHWFGEVFNRFGDDPLFAALLARALEIPAQFRAVNVKDNVFVLAAKLVSGHE